MGRDWTRRRKIVIEPHMNKQGMPLVPASATSGHLAGPPGGLARARDRQLTKWLRSATITLTAQYNLDFTEKFGNKPISVGIFKRSN